MMAPPRFLDCGECALTVEFGSSIDPHLHDRVLALDHALRGQPISGIIECVPSYRSLMVQYDPLTITRETLISWIEQRLQDAETLRRTPQRWSVPACYDPAFGEDLAVIAEWARQSIDDVIALHASAEYRLYMVGFAPGWSYLGGLPSALAIPRRLSPRPHIRSSSLIIAGGQAIIAGDAMPSGWHILGRIPERMFALDREPHYPFAIGDLIRFEPIDRATFEALREKSEAGQLVSRQRSE
jgi:inhibitor of KinA